MRVGPHDRARIAAELLGSARDDVPPPGSLERELARLDLAPPVLDASAPPAPTPSIVGRGGARSSAVVRWTVVGAAGISLASTFVVSSREEVGRFEAEQVTTVTSSSAAPIPSPPSELPAPESEPSKMSNTELAAPSPYMLPSSRPRAPTKRRTVADVSSTVAPSAHASLAEELARLDRARSLVRTRPEEALAVLDAHARDFPATKLREESAVIRVEALLSLGQRAEAARVAEPLVRSREGAPVARRLTDLLRLGGGP